MHISDTLYYLIPYKAVLTKMSNLNLENKT